MSLLSKVNKIFQKPKRKGYKISFIIRGITIETFYEKSWKAVENLLTSIREEGVKEFTYGNKTKTIFMKWDNFDYILIEKRE